MTFYQQTGISVQMSEPLISSSHFSQTLTQQISSYQHTIIALGGYNTATITVDLRQNDAEDWFANGLVRHVEVYNSALVKIWEGFVDTIRIGVGALTITRGPISSVVNRCSVIYGSLDVTQNPPIQNQQLQNTIAENTDSQDRYGIWEQVISAGQTTTTDADEMRDAYLAEYAEPETSQVLNIRPGSSRTVPVTLGCKGYRYFLDAGIYNQTTNSGTTQLETKLADILDDAGADPNTLFSSSNADIFTAGILVAQYENENLKPSAIINALVALGDGTANNGRTIWGVFNDREFVYEEVPTDALYKQRLSDPSQNVTLFDGNALVYPWDVRAGEWIFFPDFLVGQTQPALLRDDSRYLFIEQMQYTAPYGLTLNGGKVSSIPQLLARAGLGGFS